MIFEFCLQIWDPQILNNNIACYSLESHRHILIIDIMLPLVGHFLMGGGRR